MVAGAAPALLAEVWRGPVLEVAVRGHVAVVDASGRLVAHAGDPDTLTTIRSTVKPLQAHPFVAGGTCDRLGASEAELALACGSHQGEPVHVETARRLLARAGLDESVLECGPQPPSSSDAAWALAASGEPPGRIHNNCSGKHSAMAVTCVDRGWPLPGYSARDHPLQQAVAAAIGGFAGVDMSGVPWGVDGCGLPCFGLPLRTLARSFAVAGATDPHVQRCQAAMAAHPHLVAGSGRFDTALLGAWGDRLTAKIGGAGVWVAVVRPAGPAVAIKLEAGTGEHIPAVALAVLGALDLADDPLPGGLRDFGAGLVRNWAGDVVGATRPFAGLVLG